jgi:mRNA interferase HigB
LCHIVIVALVKVSTVRKWMRKHASARAGLKAWLTMVRRAKWGSFLELRSVCPSADRVRVKSGGHVYVFNIAGNRFRLVAGMSFERQMVYTKKFMTHTEYSKDSWKETL